MGTFKPVTTPELTDHPMHAETMQVDEKCATTVNSALEKGRRVIAVGTTSTRALESAAVQLDGQWRIRPCNHDTDLFILPGYCFKIVQGLITNFHLPRSTLLALVGALTGMDRLMAAYQHAISQKYRFYSYGDAMLIS